MLPIVFILAGLLICLYVLKILKETGLLGYFIAFFIFMFGFRLWWPVSFISLGLWYYLVRQVKRFEPKAGRNKKMVSQIEEKSVTITDIGPLKLGKELREEATLEVERLGSSGQAYVRHWEHVNLEWKKISKMSLWETGDDALAERAEKGLNGLMECLKVIREDTEELFQSAEVKDALFQNLDDFEREVLIKRDYLTVLQTIRERQGYLAENIPELKEAYEDISSRYLDIHSILLREGPHQELLAEHELRFQLYDDVLGKMIKVYLEPELYDTEAISLDDIKKINADYLAYQKKVMKSFHQDDVRSLKVSLKRFEAIIKNEETEDI